MVSLNEADDGTDDSVSTGRGKKETYDFVPKGAHARGYALQLIIKQLKTVFV